MAKPLRLLLVPFAVVACAHREPAPPAATAAGVATATGTAAATAAAAGGYACTQIMGVSVTGDWFGAGFEEGLDGGRWQAMWRKHAFINLWADPADALWSVPLTSPCSAGAQNPDRVIFTGVSWEYKTRAEWEKALDAVVANLRAKYPALRRIELLTMLRAPKNQSCGSFMTVVEPYIDEAVAAVAARSPGLVFVAPKVEAPTCDVFTKGGPHYPPERMPEVARLYRAALAPSPATLSAAP